MNEQDDDNGEESLAEQLYMKDLRHPRHNSLTHDEEVECMKRYRAGDITGLHDIVNANAKFAVSVSNGYREVAKMYDIPFIDIIGVANEGLMKAAERFDEKRGYKFNTYSVWWIRHAIMAFLADNARHVHIPLNSFQLGGNIYESLGGFMSRYDRMPNNLDELAAFMGKKPSLVRKAYERTFGHDLDIHLDDTAYGSQSDSGERVESNVDLGYIPPESETINTERADLIAKWLSRLTDREEFVLKSRFGIGDEEPKTLQETGDALNVSRERARQIEAKAINRLRKSKHLEHHWEDI